MKKIIYIFIGIAVIIFAAALHYSLPQVDVVRIVGTDVKRVDTKETTTAENAEAAVRTTDVYFILTETMDGEPRNYRNEDAFIYAKFDSSNLHTRARSIGQNEQNLVAVRHYGWRLPIFSMFPNAVKVWEVEPGYSHLPIFNILFLTLLSGGLGYLVWKIRSLKQRLADRHDAREAQRAEENREQQHDEAEQRARDEFLSDGDK